jgi:PTS system nitrogen regulatory IIA component
MNLHKVLDPEVIRTDLSGTSKPEVIDELLGILVATGKVTDPDAARASLLDRERKMSTGMQHGVAIPHGKTDAVDSLIACVGISRIGIDFESLDGEPSRIFIMTLSPKDRSGPHIQFLAEISQLLKSAEKREAILKAATAGELVRLLTS